MRSRKENGCLSCHVVILWNMKMWVKHRDSPVKQHLNTQDVSVYLVFWKRLNSKEWKLWNIFRKKGKEKIFYKTPIKYSISKIFKLSRSHVHMCELGHKEDWVLKNWCFQTVVLEKTLESPLDSKQNKPVNLERNQPWVFIGKTDAEAPILWPLVENNQLIVKDPDAAKDWGPEWRGWQRMRLLDGMFDSMDMSLSKLREMVKDGEARSVAVDGVGKS